MHTSLHQEVLSFEFYTTGREPSEEVLQHQFCQIFTREPEGDIPIIEPRTAEKLAAVEVTPDMVLKRLMKLKVGKSCGPDEIHPRLLCELAKQHL